MEPEKAMGNVIVIKDIQGKSVIHVEMVSMKPLKMKVNFFAHNATLLAMEVALGLAPKTVLNATKDGL